MGQCKRTRRSAVVWQQLFARQSRSGLSVAEFCAREGINASLFWRWRSTLKDAGEGQRVADPAQPAAQVAVPFIDLGELRSSGARVEVRLELGAGIVLSIARS